MGIAEKHAYRFGYLKSEQWQNVRAEVLARDGAKCFLCGQFGLSNDVHHKQYPSNVWETKAEHCITLCRKCHHKIHVITKHGIVLDEKLLRRLRGHVRSKIESERVARIKAKGTPGKRCISCHRIGVPLEPHPHPKADNPEVWMWCSECWDLSPKDFPLRWSVLRKFFDRRRENALKNVFDSLD